MAVHDESDITVVSDKGQVVIPQSIRKKLGIGPKTKLLVYGYEDAVIMKKLDISDVVEELQSLYKRIDSRRAGRLSEEEIVDIVRAYRKSQRS
jgi:AbrB family looped-hinge helix DNA binding protein